MLVSSFAHESAAPERELMLNCPVDLKDDNWETVLRTGTYNPLAAPLNKETVWIINVYGPDT
jgi:hypothetical protein